MKIELTVKKEFDVQYLQAEVGARYWDDATVNGVEDEEGDLIPCRDGDYWKPLIELESGRIVNWTQGIKADIHYKSCDDNRFMLLDEDKMIVADINGYVISMMCPSGGGHGDYVIMKVNEEGAIEDWRTDFSDFTEDED